MSDYSFLAISDVHIGAKLFNLPELSQDLKDDFVRLIDLALQLKVTYVFIAGDLFDSNKPSPDLVKFVKEQTDRAKARGLIVAGIVGDHDKPINNAAWMHLAGVIPVNRLNDHRFLGFDYDDTSMNNIQKIKECEYKDEVEWIFLHGQVPELFRFIEEKKRLDFKSIDLHKEFPKLKGIILGDIHNPLEGSIVNPLDPEGPGKYIGYCGSLGMVSVKEIDTKKGVLHYNGTNLDRHPFPLTRKFLRLDIADTQDPVINWVQRYVNFFKEEKVKKPLIIIEYNRNTKDLLHLAQPLYEIGLVRTAKQGITKETKEVVEEITTFRAEIDNTVRIDDTLKREFADEDIRRLASSLLNSDDPAAILDEYRNLMLH